MRLLEGDNSQKEVASGWLVSEDGKHRYPILDGIARFVAKTNYADNFGLQWNFFRRTQLDSYSGHPISANRFWEATGCPPDELKGEWVLDIGCGAGRFTEVALNAGAKVVAIDYSSAVESCWDNLKHHPNLHVVQADIYALPFTSEHFPFVYSLGVLQHTPDVEKAFSSLIPLLKSGGRLCVDYYEKSWKSIFLPKYWLRHITKRLPKPGLFSFLRKLVPIMLPVSRLLGSVPVAGVLLKRLVPVANYYQILPLSDEQHEEWSLLDTFDMFAPLYDHPQTATTAREWMGGAGMQDVEVLKAGHLVGRGRKRS